MTDTLAPIALADTPDVGTFLDALRPHADRDLVFEYDGQRIRPGYHVTEVKAASYQTLDCGGNPESWTEVVLQLWDVDAKDDGRPTMSVGKFLSIYDKSAAHLPLDPLSPLVLECGPRDAAAARYTADEVRPDDHAVVVALEPTPASCKPQDRWQEAERARTGKAPAPSCC